MQVDYLKQLEEAFAPYPEFVEAVYASLQAAMPEEAKKATSAKSEKKILVIDRTEIHRVLLGHYLKKLPVTLSFASTVAEAESLSKDAKFDLTVANTEFAEDLKASTIKTPVIESRGADYRNTPKDQFLASLTEALWA